eukprot:5580357-Pyramimonas_sp.AAC.1
MKILSDRGVTQQGEERGRAARHSRQVSRGKTQTEQTPALTLHKLLFLETTSPRAPLARQKRRHKRRRNHWLPCLVALPLPLPLLRERPLPCGLIMGSHSP